MQMSYCVGDLQSRVHILGGVQDGQHLDSPWSGEATILKVLLSFVCLLVRT